jgi:hypothetical protein
VFYQGEKAMPEGINSLMIIKTIIIIVITEGTVPLPPKKPI